MPVASQNAKHEIIKLIKHFKFNELEANVLPHFPETSWKKLKEDLVKNHQSVSVLNVTKILETIIKKNKIPENSLRERLSILEVIDISRHHINKVWYTYELKGEQEREMFMTIRDIETKTKELLLGHKINANVNTIFHDQIMFVAIKEKSNIKKASQLKPVFFGLLLGKTHFFCSNRNVDTQYVKVISNLMGFRDSKAIQLVGKDLSSLTKLVWQRQQRAINLHSNAVSYRDAKPQITDTGINFTQGKNRKQYIETYFGPDPPQVETLTLKCAESVWKDEEASEKLPDEKFFLEWRLNSKNINNFLQNLAEEKVLQLPMPPYLSQWATSGKNTLSLKEM